STTRWAVIRSNAPSRGTPPPLRIPRVCSSLRPRAERGHGTGGRGPGPVPPTSPARGRPRSQRDPTAPDTPRTSDYPTFRNATSRLVGACFRVLARGRGDVPEWTATGRSDVGPGGGAGARSVRPRERTRAGTRGAAECSGASGAEFSSSHERSI